MSSMNCTCGSCRVARLGETRPFDEFEESQLALELMSLASEGELELFVDELIDRATPEPEPDDAVEPPERPRRRHKNAHDRAPRRPHPLGALLKGLAKRVLPFVGGALGTLIPIPGVGTAVGSALGGALSRALEAELGEPETQETQYEMARRFVRIAGSAAQQAGSGASDAESQSALRSAIQAVARPRQARNGADDVQRELAGRWIRRGQQIVILGA